MIQLIDKKLEDLNANANECKENLNQLFEDEASFRLSHLDQKNDFIQKYTQVNDNSIQDANSYNKSLQQYMTSRMGDLGIKLENVDAANRHLTEQTLKELKDDMIGSAKEHFKQEK